MSSTTPSALVETLSGHVRKSVAKRLRPSETVRVTLRGCSSSALVCTDQRLLAARFRQARDAILQLAAATRPPQQDPLDRSAA